MSDKPIPIVNPCCFCGLPLLREMTTMDVDQIWRCNMWDDCYYRALNQTITFAGGKLDHGIEKVWYKSLLKKNPHHAWTYRFYIECLNSEGHITCTDYVDFIGIWQATTFDGIVEDALEIAQEYDLPSFRIQNSASEELYAA